MRILSSAFGKQYFHICNQIFIPSILIHVKELGQNSYLRDDQKGFVLFLFDLEKHSDKDTA